MRVHDLQEQYLNLLLTHNRLQWENYVVGAAHSLSEVDHRIYCLARKQRNFSGLSGRRETVWRAISRRELVDRHPDVSALRNRLDLDNRDHYRDGPHSTESEIAERVAPDVYALMQLRNMMSRAQGFNSYVDLVFFSEELQVPVIRQWVERFVVENLGAARRLIDRYQVGWGTWFSDLRAIGPDPGELKAGELKQKFLDLLGLSAFDGRISVSVRPDGFGFCRPLEIPTDVRVLLGNRRDPANLRTLYHELGHALGHAGNQAVGLNKTYTQSHDETMAVVAELIGLRLAISPEISQYADEIALLENVRCGISCLFEFDLWENPSETEDLFRLHYGRLGYIIERPEVWVLDTFRSLDPLYNHNYILGRLGAEQTLRYLEGRYGEDGKSWGRWLTENYYRPGREKSLSEKLSPVMELG